MRNRTTREEVLEFARRQGGIVSQSRAALPSLAFAVAEAASSGIIDEDDAAAIYENYYLAAGGECEDPSALTMRVNTSKIRCIIHCARERQETHRMFKALESIHGKIPKPLKTVGMYDAIVAACRIYSRTGRAPGALTMEKLVIRQPTRGRN
jgi:hypothetical protein